MPPGRARARQVVDADPAVLGQHVGEDGEGGVELGHLPRGRALLRAEHGGGAVRPDEGVGHVAGDPEPGVAHLPRQPGVVDRREPGERGTARRQLLAGGVQEADAEGAQQPGAPVGAGAAADADQDVPGTAPDRVRDQFAGAGGGGAHRVGRDVLDQRQPGRRRELHDRGRPVAGEGVAGLDRASERVGRGDLDRLARAGAEEAVQGALAAVGHRDRDDLGGGRGPADALLHGGAHRRGGQAALERVGRDDDPHHRSAASVASTEANSSGRTIVSPS
nr:hypothetical protein [Actinomadura madurae]